MCREDPEQPTPQSAGYTTFPPRKSSDRELFFNSHFQRYHPATEEFSSDELLFDCDHADSDVLLFPTAHPFGHAGSMSGPVDIATSRQSSGSPRSQTSNLTSQIQQPRVDVQEPTMAASNHGESQYRGRQESVGMLGTTPYGARTIPVGSAALRGEGAGTVLSGSLMNGMSWGGISVGSFIRDDILMAGTSPYNFQSPSFHSSSYLPKMEANYMKDYVCCDIRLDSMHELLQHYEEAHAAQPTQTMGRTPKDQQYPSSRAANASSTAQSVQQQSETQQPALPPQTQPQQNFNPNEPHLPTSPLFSGQSQDHFELDSLDDMDMDGTCMQSLHGSQFQPQPQFGRQQPRGPALNVNLANAFQGQGLQTPTTPRPGQQGVVHNPTVSSVNTPTLGARTASSQQTATPDSSMPGTPAEPADVDYSQLNNLNLNNFDYNALLQNGNLDLSNLNMNNLSNMQHGGSGTIDDPAKRLLSKQGYGNKGFPNPALANNSELAKRIRENQLLNGLAGVGGFVGEEIKPFKCPVIGCEKAYKNQNGLKYHKQHGHQNQQLKENPDGTFSIVDPTTSIPYPGTVGMEKEKPYRCEVCGKRYKNLNGLKYHRQHSPPCNPELKLNAANLQGMANNAQGMSANVAGAGLMGMNDGLSGY
ncbi:hypothetical protein LTR36_007304 [Oleoguttula mirabilis]|uniref:C2H2-type domain-containing protein n=1 Tax=Oleoguttula mirabilis TaxID=1507867 RepID=A0AAV9JA27_9PEZI|nr:hypothetical protein LTR36_007304 [Oleoguttula mirabilis]